MNNNEMIIPCRLSYAHLFEPSAGLNGGDPKYSTALLIDKSDSRTVNAINKMLDEAKKAGAAKWGGKIPAGLKLPLRDGDEKDDEKYASHWFINASAKRAPKIIDGRCQPIMDEEEVYSGCFANVKVAFFAYNSNGNKGIGAALVAVQKVKDGTRLAGDSGTSGFEATADTGEDFLG